MVAEYTHRSKAQPAIAATTQILTGRGNLLHVVIQAAGAGSTNTDFYDAASAAGTPIASIPGDAVAGSHWDFDIPVTTGICVVVPTAGPQLTVVYSG